ncbi:MAG: hypothetical protein LBM78_03730, partial [Clostridiales bacterium]|nr:hypothetical protein [Clostridiales bacterium]
MPLVAAKCTQCGANIQVDVTGEAGICPNCGAAFITEKVVNNYNNSFHTHVNQTIGTAIFGKEKTDADDLVRNGEVFLTLGEYKKAMVAFEKATDLNPGDWHTWFGKVKFFTRQFSDLD